MRQRACGHDWSVPGAVSGVLEHVSTGAEEGEANPGQDSNHGQRPQALTWLCSNSSLSKNKN